jgi:hypothetical protein
MGTRLRVSQVLSNHPFRAIDTALSKAPFNIRKLDLSDFSFFGLATYSEIV